MNYDNMNKLIDSMLEYNNYRNPHETAIIRDRFSYSKYTS